MSIGLEAIELNKRYPIRVAQNDPTLITMQYTFKPVSVSNAKEANIQYSGENVTLIVPTPASEAPVIMKGVANQKINECVLSFNGDEFTLFHTSMQGSVVGLKPERRENVSGFNVSKVKIAKFAPTRKRKVEVPPQYANKKLRAIEAVRSIISSSSAAAPTSS